MIGPIKLDVLFPQSLEFTQAEPGVVLFLGVDGLPCDAQLRTVMSDEGAGFRLADGIDNLFFGEFRLLQRFPPSVEDR